MTEYCHSRLCKCFLEALYLWIWSTQVLGWRCYLFSNLETFLKGTSYCEISEKPTFLHPSDGYATVYGFRNESRNLTCAVKAYPAAYFVWYKDKKLMDVKKMGVKVYNDENISILEVKFSHEYILDPRIKQELSLTTFSNFRWVKEEKDESIYIFILLFADFVGWF